ncbi:phytanoyl-CoA dioxygenase, peroxisomal-like [Bradysia coprophila]|uniref:phytanoyl-CoA dioxygenase, peroxisomal-like n=1 Tax=Bradysia coprophila TaxID=38358 RepID=UPI00187DA355|nr:phytanoyl-CoA dioxygenase, peroxisomal-like [Bradysia coprophila]
MLSEEQLSFYSKNGYLLLDSVFTPEEIEECSLEYNKLFQAKQNNRELEATWKGDWTPASKDSLKVLSIHNLQCHSAVFTRMLLNQRLVDAVSELIGSPNVLLHHTKAHVKPPGVGAPYPTHQDYHYFPFKNDSMVAAFIHFDDSDVENGGLAVFPGSHKLGPQENTSDVPTHFYVSQTKFPLEAATPIIAKKGQVVIFSYLLVHGSYQNTSNRFRRMLLLQMMSAEDEPLENVHVSPCQGMVLRGIKVKRNADNFS